jgi:hypothetical protein
VTAADPRPVADIDTLLRDAISSVHRVRWIVLIAAVLLLLGGVAYLGTLAWSQQAQIRAQQAQLQSSCGFFQPLTALPVTTPAPGKPASKLGVQIIAGARGAYTGQRCGQLTPPSASLLTWARRYGIPVAR